MNYYLIRVESDCGSFEEVYSKGVCKGDLDILIAEMVESVQRRAKDKDTVCVDITQVSEKEYNSEVYDSEIYEENSINEAATITLEDTLSWVAWLLEYQEPEVNAAATQFITTSTDLDGKVPHRKTILDYIYYDLPNEIPSFDSTFLGTLIKVYNSRVEGHIEDNTIPTLEESHSRSEELPAGRYYFGDPCYIFKETEEGNNAFLQFIEVQPGKTQFKDDYVAWYDHTAYGDGSYKGSDGTNYPVDSGTLGAVRVDSMPDYFVGQEEMMELGSLQDIDKAFRCSQRDGIFYLHKTHINTAGEPEEEEEGEDEGYNESIDEQQDSIVPTTELIEEDKLDNAFLMAELLLEDRSPEIVDALKSWITAESRYAIPSYEDIIKYIYYRLSERFKNFDVSYLDSEMRELNLLESTKEDHIIIEEDFRTSEQDKVHLGLKDVIYEELVNFSDYSKFLSIKAISYIYRKINPRLRQRVDANYSEESRNLYDYIVSYYDDDSKQAFYIIDNTNSDVNNFRDYVGSVAESYMDDFKEKYVFARDATMFVPSHGNM